MEQRRSWRQRLWRWWRAALFGVLGAAGVLTPRLAAAQQEATMGQWSQLQAWPISPTHTHLLPNGKVLFWGEFLDGFTEYIWEPDTGRLTQIAGPGYNPFCGGHAFSADGRLFQAGGHVASHIGVPNASFFDPTNETWASEPNMNAGRWYPTVMALPNGDEFVMSGETTGPGLLDPISEVFQVKSGTWRELKGAKLVLPYFPRAFVQPDGKIFIAGVQQQSYVLDPTGAGAAIPTVASHVVLRDYGGAVMYDIGKILLVGGGNPPTASAETIDLLSPAPIWKLVTPMSVARRQDNTTLLADGTVLVSGGTKSGLGLNGNDPNGAVLYPEVWDPATDTWTKLASESEFRGYHSTGLLLPDGRVLTGGGNGPAYVSSQVFSPPYLFRGARPTITSAPEDIWPAAQFEITTPDAASITKVALVRLGSVTHAWNMNQRYVPLTFKQGGTGLIVDGPKDNNIAPAGHYMLFILNSNGVPSVAPIVHIVYGPDAGPAPGLPPPPTPHQTPPPPSAPKPKSGCSAAGSSGGAAAPATAGVLLCTALLLVRRRSRAMARARAAQARPAAVPVPAAQTR